MATAISPGALVRHPAEPDWGIGRVQSSIGERVVVNFENVGKRVLNGAIVQLEMIEESRRDR